MSKKPKALTKATKTASKAPNRPKIEEVSTAALISEGKRALRDAVHHLNGSLAELGATLRTSIGDAHDRDGWSHFAWLTKNVAQVVGEVRKLDATERATSNKLTIQQVLAFVRDLAPSDREQLVADIQAIDEEGGVL